MKRAVLRAATVLAAAIAAAALAASGATASPSILQRFSVPSGDNCTYGYTLGHLEWRSAPPTSAVRVTGMLADRPFPNNPGAVCRDDSRYTIASYTAYAGEGKHSGGARWDSAWWHSVMAGWLVAAG
ncbi:hypothetical protein O7553_03525 [Solwaraspora sp. WMMA2059]|uniref:hypothetical protein n=1 Tax=Solwaraspora sp. WMMA2059 TaxID=3015160 RepID=UPI00248AB008|nr:hypothetical protein [Solwaraspora sp. WMMA2059]WBB98038.1 hypothetical protein O7553_03525 [Solwaraspora sp. WMMA2059]